MFTRARQDIVSTLTINVFPIQIEHTGRVTLLTQAIYVSKCSVR